MRVLVVDDDVRVLEVLAEGLRRHGHDVVPAPTATCALTSAALRPPDTVLLDLRLPDLDGVEVTRRLRVFTDVPILMLSGVGSEARRVAALEVGADDFLDKPISLMELIARMSAIRRRTAANGTRSSRVIRVDDVAIDLAARTVVRAGRQVSITRTEWRVLALLVSRAGEAVSYARLIGGVWSDAHGDEVRPSLRAHLRSLRDKLGDDARAPRYVRTEVGYGYRWIAAQRPGDGRDGHASPTSPIG